MNVNTKERQSNKPVSTSMQPRSTSHADVDVAEQAAQEYHDAIALEEQAGVRFLFSHTFYFLLINVSLFFIVFILKSYMATKTQQWEAAQAREKTAEEEMNRAKEMLRVSDHF